MPENKTTPVEKAAVKYKTGLLVSNSPHLVTKLDTRKTMLYVLIGLVPCAVAATIFFGPGALARILFGAIFAFLAEFCYDKIMKKPDSTGDLSCLVTGTILAMNVPADFPIWMLCIGCCVAIVIVKCLYGGIGRNIANPAIVGRIVLLLSWTSYMTTWPVTNFQKATVDATTGRRPYRSAALLDVLHDHMAGDELPEGHRRCHNRRNPSRTALGRFSWNNPGIPWSDVYGQHRRCSG